MIFELCCGSLDDSVIANDFGASRIELNTSLALGGITPSIGLVKEVLDNVDIPVTVMIRPRAGGFNYTELDYTVMLRDLDELLELDIEGIAFGFLTEDCNIDETRTKEFIDRIKHKGKKAVFHRAFDNTKDKGSSIELLIRLGCHRVLTSGGKETSAEGMDNLKYLQDNYGKDIVIVAGSGINLQNVESIVKHTGVKEIHSSCKEWKEDRTSNSFVNYDYNSEYKGSYDGASIDKVKGMKDILNNL